MPTTIPYVSPDSSKTVFSAPATNYSFHQPSHTFTGQNVICTAPGVEDGACFIVAKFNYAGELEHGTIKVVGGIPDLNVRSNTILLQGSIINVDTFSNTGFRANFIFRIHLDHPSFGYDSHIGVWNAYMDIPGWPSHFHRYLFRRTWGPAAQPLNSYIGQVKNIV